MSVNELSPTEILAITLFGWGSDHSKNKDPQRYREYILVTPDGYRHSTCWSIKQSNELLGDRFWPAFSGPTAREWVHRMELAIKEKGLLPDYLNNMAMGAVHAAVLEYLRNNPAPPDDLTDYMNGFITGLFIPIPERIAAAVRILKARI